MKSMPLANSLNHTTLAKDKNAENYSLASPKLTRNNLETLNWVNRSGQGGRQIAMPRFDKNYRNKAEEFGYDFRKRKDAEAAWQEEMIRE